MKEPQTKKVGRSLSRYEAIVVACKIMGFFFIGCVLFLAVFLCLASVQIVRGTLNHFAERLQKESGLQISFNEVHVKSFFQVSVDSLFIASADQKIVIYVKNVKAKLSVLKFFYQQIPVKSLEIDEPSVFIQRDERTAYDFPKNLPSLPKIHIKNGMLRLLLSNQEVSLSGVTVDYDVSYQKHQLLFSISDVLMADASHRYVLTSLEANTFFYGQNLLQPLWIQIENLAVNSPEFEMQLKGDVRRPNAKIGWQLKGHVDVSDVHINDIHIPGLSSDIIVNQHDLEMRQAQVNVAGTKANVLFRLKWQKKIPFTLYLNAKDISLHDLLSQLGIPKSWVELGIDLDATATGSLWPHFKLNATAKGTAHDLVVARGSARDLISHPAILQTSHPIDLVMKIEVDPNSFRFRSLHFDDGFSKGTADCTLFFDAQQGLSLQGKLDQVDFASIGYQIANVRYKGIGHADLNIKGDYGKLKILSHLDMKNFLFEDYELGDLKGEGKYQAGHLSFEIDEAKIRNSKYQGTLDLAFEPILEANLFLELTHLYVQDLLHILPRQKSNFLAALQKMPWKGAVSGHLHLNGPIEKNHEQQLLGSGMINIVPGFEWFEAIVNDGSLHFHIDNEFAYIDHFNVNSTMGFLNGSGKLNKRQGELQANLHAEKIQTKQIHIGDADLSLSLRNHQLFIQGPVFATKGYAYLQFDLTKDLPFKGNVRLQYTSLDEIFTQASLPENFSAFAGAEINFSGKANDFAKTKGKLSFYPVSMTYGNLKLLSSGPILAQFEGPNVDVERWVMQTSHKDTFRVKGRWSPEHLDLHVQAQGDLWLLPFLDERIDMAYGDFSIDVGLLGNSRNPILKGQWQIENAFVSLRDYAYAIENTQLKGRFDKHQLYVDRLHGLVKDGSFFGDGFITFNHYWPHEYNMNIRFTDIPILSPWITGSSHGRLKLNGLAEDPLLAGEVYVQDGLVTKEFNLDQSKSESYSRYRLIDTRRKNSKPLRFNVHLQGNKGIRIENSFLNAALEADLFLVGNKENPGLKGTVDAALGDIFFRNHRYRLQKAKVYFDNPSRILPRVDIEAEGRISDYDILARFEGNPNNLQLQLQSRPSLSEADILSLMTMGFVNREVKDVMKTAQAAGLEALSMYSGINKSVTQLLSYDSQKKNWIRMNDFKLTSLFSHGGGMSLPAVMVGVDIWHGMRFKLQSALMENENGNREQLIELEHHLNRNMRWRFSWNSEGQSNYGDAGVDLWYRLEL